MSHIQKGHYDEEQIINLIGKRADIAIRRDHKAILWLNKGKGDVGIGTRGKIDFLVNHCGYVVLHVNRFN